MAMAAAAAAATAISGCTTTGTQFMFFKASYTVPFLLRNRRRRGVSIPSAIFNNHNYYYFPPPPPLIPIPHPLAINYRNNNSISAAEGRRRRRMQQQQQQLLLCYCTEAAAAEAQSSRTTTTETETETTTLMAIANSLDIRVGRIVKIWRHEEADSLYVEEVDVGEPQPRTICSGLVKYIPIHLLQDKNVIVLANLKPRNMRGVKSSGMLMAASDASHENVELLVPPEGALPGERVWFGSVDEKDNLPEVASPNQVQKKKIWELVQPHLRTDESCVASLGTTHYMRTSAGPITSQSLKCAIIS